ncbi:UNVERIFIED_CONTAM: hypothetical protein PYX00_008199 [Menopon gallinae]|uniref:Cysteine sulfinic acid decarboxylase n=1 Tax=Menopon gallinae TaxID=328185 RepID=A0AAW2HLZ9_9NEOP
MISIIPKQENAHGFIKPHFESTFEIDRPNIAESPAGEEDGLPPRLRTLPREDLHSEFIKKSAEIIIKNAVFDGTNRENKVLEWRDPQVLEKAFDYALRREGETDERLYKLIGDVIKYSVKTGHPYFVNQLFSGVDPYGLVGQWLTDALNPSVYTYEVAPVLTIMEEVVLKEMREIVGFPNGEGDGVFCPGGSVSNGYAISCARYHFCPEIKKIGLCSVGRLIVFTSRDAHYSVVKLATFMGLGSENVWSIPTDSRGKMIPEDLESSIVEATKLGCKPFMVSATAGTTVLGAFDPLERIAEICKKHNLWFHVDAAWGGGCLMSSKYRYLLQGIERADSVTWNPHKLLAAPQQCSAFLVRHKGLLSECHSTNATYLFQKDKFYDVKYDTGDKHIQCGRRGDVLKFWFMWKAKGKRGFEQHINKIFSNSEYFLKQIDGRPDFKLVLPKPECTNVCFWYIPPSLQNKQASSEDLHKVAPKIKERMMKEGSMMVTYQPLRELPNFFRLVIENSGLEHEDMDRIIETFQRLGADL